MGREAGAGQQPPLEIRVGPWPITAATKDLGGTSMWRAAAESIH